VLAFAAAVAYPVDASEAPAEDASAPRSAAYASLRLAGVVTSPSAGVRRVIVSHDGAQRSYRIGDVLLDGSVLVAVQPDRVVLLADGKHRVVQLSGDFDLASSVASPAAPLPGLQPATAESEHEALASVVTNPALLLELLPVEAIMDRHRMVAVRLVSSAEGSLATALGLMPGDVITAINGVALNGADPRAWTRADLRRGRGLELTVYREGGLETLRLQRDRVPR